MGCPSIRPALSVTRAGRSLSRIVLTVGQRQGATIYGLLGGGPNVDLLLLAKPLWKSFIEERACGIVKSLLLLLASVFTLSGSGSGRRNVGGIQADRNRWSKGHIELHVAMGRMKTRSMLFGAKQIGDMVISWHLVSL